MASNEKTTMEIIREGLKARSKSNNEEFADSVYSLFKEFADDYKDEWNRLDENEKMYRGDHWDGITDVTSSAANLPKPTTPIITSTIENLKADLSDEFPEAVIQPSSPNDNVTAKVLTKVISQDLAVCGFEREYDMLVHDVLVDGWGVTEVGHDPEANCGIGCSYQRHISNKNILFDPQCSDMQAGRAVFKFDTRPNDWFVQHYPDIVDKMTGDTDLIDETHSDFSAPTAPKKKQFRRLIEAWFRIYDPKTKKHAVHMVLCAGHQILENSAIERPDGYFKHGKYPFVITTLFPEKGSCLGFGVVDLFKETQRYSDKLDQILMTNAFRASRTRMYYQSDAIDASDVRDFSKEAIPVNGSPSAIVAFQDTPPLPSYLMAYIAQMRESIKTESGSNEQSRGQTSSGVTAASAITALQDMATKRSRMEGRAIHYGFRACVSMQLEVIREFSTLERTIVVTDNGKVHEVPFSNIAMKEMLGENSELPIEFYVDIRSARQTKYTKLAHNEFWLQMLNILRDRVDPVLMLEGIEADDKEELLENIRRAQNGGMMALQQQLAMAQQQLAQQEELISQQNSTISQMSTINRQQQEISNAEAMSNMQWQNVDDIPEAGSFDVREASQSMY